MSTFPNPSQIQDQYFTILKSIKPSLNINDINSDFVIRGKAFSGLASGLYGDQQKVNNDTWINSARPEALTLFGQDFNIPQLPATPADSTNISVPGTNGTIVGVAALTFLYVPTGILYQNTTGGTVSGGTLTVSIVALVAGSVGNVKAPDTLQIISPPFGIGGTANVVGDIGDGADVESTDSYRARLLSRVQSPPAGGNETDYPNFAFAADPSVRSVFIKRFGRGLGTVDVYITTGTTDIDNAVTNGLSIVRIPGPGVLATVQAYYDSHAPLTDCAVVYAPTQVSVNATVNVELAPGLTLTSVPTDPLNNPLNLTVLQLIQREIGRPMYKLPVGGRLIPGFTNGFVPAADLEENLDIWLSAVKDPNTNLFIGKIPILANRQVQKLDPPKYDKALTGSQLAAPGTITVVQGGLDV